MFSKIYIGEGGREGILIFFWEQGRQEWRYGRGRDGDIYYRGILFLCVYVCIWAYICIYIWV
jgi:hypothetical protein